MYFVRIIDDNGFFVEDAFVEELTDKTIQAQCPSGFYKPKWNGTAWAEGATQAEIDAVQSVVTEPTERERLEALEAAMLELVLGGA